MSPQIQAIVIALTHCIDNADETFQRQLSEALHQYVTHHGERAINRMLEHNPVLRHFWNAIEDGVGSVRMSDDIDMDEAFGPIIYYQ